MTQLSNRIKSELALVADSDSNSNYFKFITEVNSIIEKYDEAAVKIGLDLITKSWFWKPWGSLDLDNTQFDSLGRHIRCWYIQNDGKAVHNVMAYTQKQRRIYLKESDGSVKEIKEPTLSKEGEIIDERVYISKGGIINGDYIYKCYLKDQINKYIVKDPIKLPVSTIEYADKPDIIFFVDHREPKLKALMEFYNVPIQHDEYIKFNVRTFKKLK